MATPIYNINLPTPDGNIYTWQNILNDDTFANFDNYLQYNPSSYHIINASGLYDSAWYLQHSSVNSSTFTQKVATQYYYIQSSGENIPFLFTTGSQMYKKISSVGLKGPGGIYIPLHEPEQIGDWISDSTTSATDVDLSDDGVPSGASSAAIAVNIVQSSLIVVPTLVPSLNGTDLSYTYRVSNTRGNSSLQGGRVGVFTTRLDNSAKFQARFSNSFVSITNTAYVLGYYI